MNAVESMTGFGEGTAEGSCYRVSARARSVNHRFLDVVLRLPEPLRRHERLLAAVVRDKVSRGRIEVRIEYSQLEGSAKRALIDHELLRLYAQEVSKAQTEGLLEDTPSAGEMLGLPEVVTVESGEREFEEDDLGALRRAVADCVEDLVAARRAEGRKLQKLLHGILHELRQEVDGLIQMQESLQGALAARLQTRVQETLGEIPLDPDRLATEVAMLCERSDVQEELDRLGAHIESFSDLLTSEEPSGKKLDFLCQEILRELNTVGSKCRETKAVEHVLDGKVACEKLREQVQNIQ